MITSAVWLYVPKMVQIGPSGTAGQKDNDVVFTLFATLTKYKRYFLIGWYIAYTGAVNTGALFTLPVFTGRIEKKHCTTMLFLNTARVHGCPVHTSRVHGPWTRVKKTQLCSRAVHTGREHGLWTRLVWTGLYLLVRREGWGWGGGSPSFTDSRLTKTFSSSCCWVSAARRR